jgi:hypothetical protein
VAWVVGLDLQLDASVGHTWLDRGGEWFVSGGITLRRRNANAGSPAPDAHQDR